MNIQTTMYKILGLAGIVLAGLSACPDDTNDSESAVANDPPLCTFQEPANPNLRVTNGAGQQLVLYTSTSGNADSAISLIPNDSRDCYITIKDVGTNQAVNLVLYAYDDVQPTAFDASEADPFFDAGQKVLSGDQVRPFFLPIPEMPTDDGMVTLVYSDPAYEVSIFLAPASGVCPDNLDDLSDLLTYHASNLPDQVINYPFGRAFQLLFAYWIDDENIIAGCKISDQVSLNADVSSVRIDVPAFVPDAAATTSLRVINNHSDSVTVFIDNIRFGDSEEIVGAGLGTDVLAIGDARTFLVSSTAAGITYTFRAIDRLGMVVEQDVITLTGETTEWLIDGSVRADRGEPCAATYIQCVDNLVCGYTDTCQPTHALGGACNVDTQCQETLFCALLAAADNGHDNSCQSDATILALTAAAVEIGYAEGDSAFSVTQDLELPTSGGNGVTISWSSNNPAIIADDGRVTRLVNDAPVTLTATLTRGSAIETRDFMLSVFPTEEGVVTSTAAALEIGYAEGDTVASVTQDLTLPTAGMHGVAISWMSDTPATISDDGAVMRGDSTVVVRLTATLTKGDARDTRVFMVTVLISDEASVAHARAALEIGYAAGDSAASVTHDLVLPTSGLYDTEIEWVSNEVAAISNTGAVTRGDRDVVVTLVAVITKHEESDTKEFMVTVLTSDEAIVASAKEALEIGYADGDSSASVTQDLTLQTVGLHNTMIVWSSSAPATISTNGQVTRGFRDMTVTLTAMVTRGTAIGAKQFVLFVPIADQVSVAAARSMLEIGYAAGDSAGGVTGNLHLPTSGADGVDISWASSEPTAITDMGIVTVGDATVEVTLTATLTKGEASATRIFTIVVRGTVAAAKAALEIGYAEGDSAVRVTQDVILLTSGLHNVAISWSSSNPAVLASTGTVTRIDSDVAVTLTATLTSGAATDTKQFLVTVVAATDATLVANAKASLEIGYAEGDSAARVTQDLTLPISWPHGVAVSWGSSNLAVIATDGMVTPGGNDMEVTLTATLTRGASHDTKQFLVMVIATDASRVAGATASLEIGYAEGDSANGVTQDLTLPISWPHGVAVSWGSSNLAVIATDGTVTRGDGNVEVTLTATLTRGASHDTKQFQVTVPCNTGFCWTSRTSGTSQHLYGIVWSGSQYVAVGQSGTILTSSDGVIWTPRTSGTSQELWDIVWSGSQYVAVGQSGTILTSSDGVIWTPRTSGTSQRLDGIVWSGSQYVAVGVNDTILTSSDGVSWTRRTSGTSQHLLGIVWSGSQYVAVGSGGTILTSSDGVSWTGRTSGTSWDLWDIVWSGSQYVAVGFPGTILTSSDGVGWTPRTSGTTPLNRIVWSGSQYVAVGRNGTILTSSDGVGWTPRTSGAIQNLLGIGWSGSQYVAVGGDYNSSTILTSP